MQTIALILLGLCTFSHTLAMDKIYINENNLITTGKALFVLIEGQPFRVEELLKDRQGS